MCLLPYCEQKERRLTVLKNRIERMKMQCLGIGPLMLLPFLANYLFLPLSIYLLSLRASEDAVATFAWKELSIFFPLMSVWWILLLLERRMQEQGEIFFLYERTGWLDVLLYYVLYVLVFFPLCIWFMNQWSDMIWFYNYLDLLGEAFFLSCWVYLLCHMSGAIVAPFITVLVFSLFLDGRLYMYLERYGMDAWLSAGGYMVVGILCLLLGMTFQNVHG